MRFLTDLAGEMHPDARAGFGELLRAIVQVAEDDGELSSDEVAMAVRPFTWLLEQVRGGGVRLTQAGYLPPALVTATMQELGWHDRWIGKQNREDQTPPVLELRTQATELGLLRKYRGVLLPTRVGARLTRSPHDLWDHLADRIVARETGEPLLRSVTLLLVGVATRSYTSRDRYLSMIANGLQNMGWVTTEYRRASTGVVAANVDGAYRLLDALGSFEVSEYASVRWGAGTRVGAAFARQALAAIDPFEGWPVR